MSAAAVIVARQNKLIRRFWEAGATAPKFARSPEDLGCRNSWIFRRLVTRGVFEETKPSLYYVDEVAADNFVRVRRAKASGMLTGCLGPRYETTSLARKHAAWFFADLARLAEVADVPAANRLRRPRRDAGATGHNVRERGTGERGRPGREWWQVITRRTPCRWRVLRPHRRR